jgi:hypothetical protein
MDWDNDCIDYYPIEDVDEEYFEEDYAEDDF